MHYEGYNGRNEQARCLAVLKKLCSPLLLVISGRAAFPGFFTSAGSVIGGYLAA